MGVQDRVGLAGDARVDHIADREDPCPFAPPLLEGGNRIGRLPGLGDGDEERVLPDQRVAVAELARQVHLHRHGREGLDHELAHQGGVIGGPARHDPHAPDSVEGPGTQAGPVQVDPVGRAGDPAADRVRDRPGLLEDLLEHEVLVAPLLRHDERPLDGARLPVHRLPLEVGDLQVVGPNHGHLPVLQENHTAGVLQQGRDVRGDEVFPFSEADHEGAGLLGPDEQARLATAERTDCVRALDLAKGRTHGAREVEPFGDLFIDQVRDDLRIGLRAEGAPPGLQLLPKGQVVLYNSVVYHNHVAGTVGVGVDLRGAAVSSPPGVPDADGPPARSLGDLALEVVELPFAPADLYPAALQGSEARRIVSSVFEAPQPRQEQGRGLAVPYVSDYAAHGLSVLWLTASQYHRAGHARLPFRNAIITAATGRPI